MVGNELTLGPRLALPHLWEGVWSLCQAFSGLWAQVPCSGICLSMSVLLSPGPDWLWSEGSRLSLYWLESQTLVAAGW